MALLLKDFRNARASMPPAILLGVSLLLILEFTQSPLTTERMAWRSAYWIIYFFGVTSLFYRSFGFENHSNTFHIYRSFCISPLKVLLSQCLVHCLSASIIGITYLFMTVLFWSPTDLNWASTLVKIVITSVILSPIGTTLGLMLQMEREFLFSLTFLPLATPVVLGAYALELQSDSAWPWILAIFFVGGCFLSALVFQFFFDDLTN